MSFEDCVRNYIASHPNSYFEARLSLGIDDFGNWRYIDHEATILTAFNESIEIATNKYAKDLSDSNRDNLLELIMLQYAYRKIA